MKSLIESSTSSIRNHNDSVGETPDQYCINVDKLLSVDIDVTTNNLGRDKISIQVLNVDLAVYAVDASIKDSIASTQKQPMKSILSNISATVSPMRLVAIMGGSGSGSL